MTFLERQILLARRRLGTNLLLHWLSITVLAAAAAWGLTIIVARLFDLAVPVWHVGWAAAAAAVVGAFAATYLSRPTALQAAVALDGAAGLKERLSSALVMYRSTDPFAQAAVRDAEKTAGHIHVPTHIRHAAPQLWPWSAATVCAALLVAWLMPTVGLFAAEPEDDTRQLQSQARQERAAIQAEFEQRAARMKELAQQNENLKDLAEDLMAPLEMPEGPSLKPEDVREQAVQRLDNVKDKLKRELEATEQSGLRDLQRMFKKLDEPGNQEANDKLSKALADGDFKAAKDALEQMARDIEEAAKNANDPEAQRKLAEMQQKLQRLADQVAKLSDTLRIQKELENKAGMSEEEAKKLLDKLANMDPKQLEKELQKQLGDKGMTKQQIQQLAKKLQQNQKAQKQCKNLANALAKAAQACQQCQSPGSQGQGAAQASNALSDAASQLSELEMAEMMMNELQAQMSQLEQTRQDVCEGGMCQGERPGPGQGQDKPGMQGPNYGRGFGERFGKERTAHDMKAEKAKTRYETGTVIGRMLVEGPQIRGDASAEEIAAAMAEVREMLDNVEREDVPRQYHKALREYFERLAGLMRERQAAGD